MANPQELEQRLEREQADYLARLQGAGQLPRIISEEWQKAGGAETARLRGKEAGLLTEYVSSGARAREKYKDVWDPFARERLASSQMGMEYKPIADIRSELAMRAEALGIATSSATAMYGAETQRAGTSLGFTESAYQRALQREQEGTRQREREQERQWQLEDEARAVASRATGGGGGGGKAKASKPADDLQQDISDNFEYWASEVKASPAPGWTENVLLPALLEHYLKLGLTRAEIQKMVYETRSPYEAEGYF